MQRTVLAVPLMPWRRCITNGGSSTVGPDHAGVPMAAGSELYVYTMGRTGFVGRA